MAGIPLKSGADFYVLEAARMRLHNLGADPTEYGDGLIYFNNSDGNNTSRRARIYDGTTFRSLAFLDEIANNEAFNALVGRVDEAEGDIDSLEGRATSLEGRATATEGNLSTLKARVDAFLDGGVDSDAVLENLKEIQAFLDAYDGATSLAEMFDAVNTQIADRYTKAEADGRFLKLTGGVMTFGSVDSLIIRKTTNNLLLIRFDGTIDGVNTPMGYLGFYGVNNPVFYDTTTKPFALLHAGNYSDLITTINKSLSIKGNVTVPNDYGILSQTSAGNVIQLVGITTTNKFYIGTDAALQNGVPSVLFGKTVDFITGNSLAERKVAATIDADGNLHVFGNIIADGEVSAGGAGEEGSDDMGLALLENWADYDATKAQALGAVLGKDMYDRIVILEGKSTNVQFTPTLSSGKQIGAITIDGVTTGIFAPDKLSQFTDDVVAGKYLPLSGGELKGRNPYLQYILTLDTDNAFYTILSLKSQGVRKGMFAWADDENVMKGVFMQNNTTNDVLGLSDDGLPMYNKYTLLHTRNVGDYALKTDGSNKMTGDLQLLTMSSGSANVAVTEGLFLYYGPASGGADVDLPDNYINMFNIGGHNTYSNLQLAWRREYPKPILFARISESNGYSDWKTLAFTDSDITGNAATATKLATARTIWGQSFDGTRDVSGILKLGYSLITGESNENAFELASDALTVGYGYRSLLTTIYGGTLRFAREGAVSMTITAEGKVGIGNTTPIAPLTVAPKVNGEMELGTTNGIVFAIQDQYKAYGINFNVRPTGIGEIQVGRTTGEANSFALNLNPLGGAVNIASADALTNVLGHMVLAKDLRMNGFLMMNTGKEGIYLAASTINWHDSNNTYADSLIRFASDSVTVHPNLLASRILINGVSDDGSTALALRGALKVCRTTSSKDTFLEVTSNDTIVKYRGYGGSDGFCSHDFYSHDKLLLHISATNATSQFYTRLAASGLITASGGLYIPTGQSFKIGEATLSWDADKNALKVDKNIYSDGEVSAGGAGEEGETESTGNASAWAQTFTPTNTTMPFEHNRATTDVIVQVYEKNDGGSWDMILVDVEIISETKVNLHFGRTENREHKIVIMG